MTLLGKKWPVPVARPMYPFYIAGGIVFLGVWKAQNAMSMSDEYKNDPRNPKAKTGETGAH